jgi:hypothetical protein
MAVDIRIDMTLGLWFEAAWISKEKNMGDLTHQTMVNVGLDYTFGFGNGLYTILEHLIFTMDNSPFIYSNASSFSALSLSYPLGFFDNLDYIAYFSWTDSKFYNILSWNTQLDKAAIYLLGHWNPQNAPLTRQGRTQNLFSGQGVQIMVVVDF